MSKACFLSKEEQLMREEDLADYKAHIGPEPENIEEYDFRRGWEYCLGRTRTDEAQKWEEVCQPTTT